MLLPLFAIQDAATRVEIARTGLEQAALFGQALTSLLVLALLVAATLALLALRRALDELTRLVRSTSSDITAAVHDAREVADELRRLTGRVRDTADVVRAGAHRVRRMVERGDESREVTTEATGEPGPRPDRDRRRRKRRRPGDRPRREDGAEGSGSSASPADADDAS